ncbi:tetratricopeptide repeat protein [Vampirovibrio chlorellavorus]|uniref:tetratricopeptide repeat protein n=1 Tax=Vampirovibrio chlorellavorus TaxID=758823 RepID=UPI0026F2CB47|nr:hypothetical protein [Vampirovibrio chlorellavorus]
MAVFSQLNEARDLLFRERKAPAAEKSLGPLMKQAKSFSAEEQRALFELMGLALRAQGRFVEAAELYTQVHDYYQSGYCAMLQGKTQAMQQAWSRVLSQRQNHWCVSLYGLISGQLRTVPTIFQIRNHMESDIANLIAANRVEYLENYLNYVDFLTQVNLEAPKFAGRALMNAGWLDRAGKYLLQGQKALPNDPEIYFHLGQYSMASKHLKEARLMLNQCLLISPTYRPASDLLETLTDHSPETH